MRALRLIHFAIPLAALTVLSAPISYGSPTVAFQTNTLAVTPSATFTTPPIVIQDAAGVTAANITITVPADVTLNTNMNGANLSCVTQGTDAGTLFFSEWDSSTRKISITCTISAGSTVEIVRSIQFTTPANPTISQFTLAGSVTGGSGVALFGSLTLTPPHIISVSTAAAISPTEVESGGTTSCSVTAADSYGHGVLYQWSDGGKGGSFSPSASGQSPSYIAPQNITGTNATVPLTCTITCSQNALITGTSSVNLTVKPVPPKTVQVTSTPNAVAQLTFAPSPDGTAQASPKALPVTLSYAQDAQGITLTAPKQDGATHPLWFDHWVLDGVDQPQDTVLLTFDMAGSNHTATAVYGKLVGDIDANGIVDSTDADLILKVVLGEALQTALMDVDQDGTVGLKDAQWVLKHRTQ